MEHLKSEILRRTNNGLDIFRYYIPDIAKQGTSKNFMAVFRDDGKTPSANVFLNKQKNSWLYKDFVNGETLNPFDFVMKYCRCDFKQALDMIQKDILSLNIYDSMQNTNSKSETMNFSIVPCDDFSYWFDFGERKLILETLEKYNVKALKSYTFSKNSKSFTVNASKEDPIFAFCLSEACYKIYRPHAKKKNAKHLWLGQKPLEYRNVFGLHQLPQKADFILIVEGLKDLIVAHANGLIAVGVDNVSTNIHKEDMAFMKSISNNILLCYDIDEAGRTQSQKKSALYGLRELILPESLIEKGGKDISDFFSLKHSYGEIKSLIHNVIATPLPATKQKLSKFEKVEQLLSENFVFRYNVVSNEVEYHKIDAHAKEYKQLNESNIYRFLQHQNVEFSIAKLNALLASDFVEEFNPFALYFENLSPWDPDSEIDYIHKLCQYVPVVNKDSFYTQLRKTFVRSIACTLDEKVFNKHAFILVHDEQNSGKSTFIRWLCPEQLGGYYSENISTDKDGLIALSENFIINLDELSILSKADINSLKSILSKEKNKVRKPYAKTATTAPRRANFFGSTNKTEFLNDESGSVRWLCFELTAQINWDYKKDLCIDDIWRQAYYLYKNNFNYQLTPEEIKENEIVNQNYQETTPEIELIQKHFTPGTKEAHQKFYQTTEFFNILTQKYPNMRFSVNNIGKALKMLGFKRCSKRFEGFPIKGYYINYINVENNI